jgi:regulator of sigma E protease
MLVQIAQLFLSLTILITLHEFGHFWFAKRFGCKVEKFYLFFDFLFPFPNIANFALFKKKIGDTEYGLGWFPFGGYVSIAGMVDEQMDKEIIEKPAEPWELRSKPAWQRLLVMMGGILVNFLLGIVIFWMALLVWGKQTLPVTKLPHGLAVDSVAYKLGLRNGDYITSVDGKYVKSINRIPIELIINGGKTIEGVHANGQKFSITVTNDQKGIILKRLKKTGFIAPRILMPSVDSVSKLMYAANADIKSGDLIIKVNEQKITFFDEFQGQLAKNAKGEVNSVILRNADTVKTKCKVNEDGQIGIVVKDRTKIEPVKQSFNVLTALTQGTRDGLEQVAMRGKELALLFTVKDAYKQVGGFSTMAKQMSTTWDWQHFWMFTALLSFGLAFMNFLPIPMLDGGYIMFILFEMITGKKVSDKFIYYANQVGLFIVLALMIFANTDFLRD